MRYNKQVFNEQFHNNFRNGSVPQTNVSLDKYTQEHKEFNMHTASFFIPCVGFLTINHWGLCSLAAEEMLQWQMKSSVGTLWIWALFILSDMAEGSCTVIFSFIPTFRSGIMLQLPGRSDCAGLLLCTVANAGQCHGIHWRLPRFHTVATAFSILAG